VNQIKRPPFPARFLLSCRRGWPCTIPFPRLFFPGGKKAGPRRERVGPFRDLPCELRTLFFSSPCQEAIPPLVGEKRAHGVLSLLFFRPLVPNCLVFSLGRGALSGFFWISEGALNKEEPCSSFLKASRFIDSRAAKRGAFFLTTFMNRNVPPPLKGLSILCQLPPRGRDAVDFLTGHSIPLFFIFFGGGGNTSSISFFRFSAPLGGDLPRNVRQHSLVPFGTRKTMLPPFPREIPPRGPSFSKKHAVDFLCVGY